MTTNGVTEHVQSAKEFLERSKSYLAEGDLHQASENGWGAAAHIIKAVAAANGWEYEHHDQFSSVVMNARQRYRQPSLREMSRAAEALNVNYYNRKELLNSDLVREDIGDVEQMVQCAAAFYRLTHPCFLVVLTVVCVKTWSNETRISKKVKPGRSSSVYHDRVHTGFR